MSWQAYEVTLRLLSPMHIGWGKVGNIQRTRPYVTGRVLWGALAARLARAAPGAPTPADYDAAGRHVHERLAFTYFYPAARVTGGKFQARFPWSLGEAAFDRRYISSYAGTALTYPEQAAAEATLHEIEFISPRVLDSGNLVYLLGYVFARDDAGDGWQAALGQAQLGGERGYGWGRVALERVTALSDGDKLFDKAAVTLDGARPRVMLLGDERRLLAHTLAGAPVAGQVEPLVGREWREGSGRGVGQHLDYNGICFLPGGVVLKDATFAIGRHGVWQVD